MPSRIDWESWTAYVFHEYDYYVRCRTCRRVGLRNKADVIFWYARKPGLELVADAIRWNRSLLSK